MEFMFGPEELELLQERNFAACCIIIFCAFAVLYSASTSLPALLQTLSGYDALNAGLVMSPAGFFAVPTNDACRGILAGPENGCALVNRQRPADHDRRDVTVNLTIGPGQVVC
jgi:hypothetical protein